MMKKDWINTSGVAPTSVTALIQPCASPLVPGSLKDVDIVMWNTLMLGFQPLGP